MGHTVTELEHTADTGILVSADGLGELFAAAATGMFDVMYRIPGRAAGRSRRFTVALEDPAEALWSLLSDLLSHAEADDVAFAGIEGVVADAGRRVVVDVTAVPLAEVETVGPPIKAVTWHRLAVTPDRHRWTATVVFDI